MDPDILNIKLCEESKQWDKMVDRVTQYLKDTHEDKKKIFADKVKAKEEKDNNTFL